MLAPFPYYFPAKAVSFPSLTAPTNIHHPIQGRSEESRSDVLKDEPGQAHQKEIASASGSGWVHYRVGWPFHLAHYTRLSLEPMGGFRTIIAACICRELVGEGMRHGPFDFLRFITRSAYLAFEVTIMIFTLIFHQRQKILILRKPNMVFCRRVNRSIRVGVAKRSCEWKCYIPTTCHWC